VIALGLLSLAVWVGLLTAHGGFWLARERDTAPLPAPARWPSVVAIVPARDEADVIARAASSLAAQDYAGEFRVVLVDDGSGDGTGALARSALGSRGEVRTGAPLPAGWTGKLWAVSQGVAAAGSPDYLWLTDADIEHAPDTLASLVARAEGEGRVLVSLMAKLRCDSFAERALVPAFIFFFMMLYPFSRINSAKGLGAAAGGCMLVRREALERAGGVGAIRGALIDDCAFGAMMKRQGRVWLGLTDRSRSIRPYEDAGAIAAMISRSAYAQLRYNPWLLAGTLLGLALVYAVPPVLALAGHGVAQGLGVAAWLLMAISFQPILRLYGRSPLWGLALPLIAAFYAGCTLLSAWQHSRGRGGLWKGRAQAMVGR
jgi:hopene-associated glycosyltransferase HpnB